MKTNKYLSILILLLIAMGVTSCGNFYRMTSHINPDGSMYREVYALGDSAFLKGDMKKNPFFFQVNPGWKVTPLDSVVKFSFWGNEHKLNVKVSRTLPAVGDQSFNTLKGGEFMKPLVVPNESLGKNFRWFYTYYTYKAVYEELPDKGPVPLDKYLTKEEQDIWFKGNKEAFAGLNGMELNSSLDDIQYKFWQWYNRSQYEFCYETIKELTDLQKEKGFFESTLSKYKEEVYKKNFANKDSEMEDISLATICKLLDEQGKTTRFVTLYQDNKTKMEAELEAKSKITELFNYTIWFEVSMPGKVLAVNESGVQQKNDALVWRVDAFRILSGEYILEAESRTTNYWAFVVTLLLIVVAGVGCWRLARRR